MKDLLKILSILNIILLAACSEYIDYKDYTNGEEIRYAGKANDPFYLAGNERIEIKYILGPDPNINKSVIYWNLREKSVTIDIDRAKMDSDTVSYIFEEMPENTYSFEIFNYDVYGNASVPTYLTAKSYGAKYISGLYDRNLEGYEAIFKDGANSLDDVKGVKINWGDSITGTVGMRLEYYVKGSNKVKMFIPNKELFTVLDDIDASKPIQYQTLHIPEVGAIDTFTIAPVEFKLQGFNVEIAKPYASATVSDFDSPTNNEWNALWDGRWGKTFDQNWNGTPWADESGWTSFYTNPPSSLTPEGKEATWFTIDVKEHVKLSRYRTGLYWPYMAFCPKQTEIWAYTGDSTPTASEGWNNWVKIGSIDNSTFLLTTGDMIREYPLGDNIYFDADLVPRARYYRVVCTQTWEERDEQSKVAMTIAEVTFWKFLE